jgi:hypothetical protein
VFIHRSLDRKENNKRGLLLWLRNDECRAALVETDEKCDSQYQNFFPLPWVRLKSQSIFFFCKDLLTTLKASIVSPAGLSIFNGQYQQTLPHRSSTLRSTSEVTSSSISEQNFGLCPKYLYIDRILRDEICHTVCDNETSVLKVCFPRNTNK